MDQKLNLNFWVVGGDLRQAKLAELLIQDGHAVHTYALPPANGLLPEPSLTIAPADCVVLPLAVCSQSQTLNAPFSRETISLGAILDSLHPGQLLFGGRVDPEAETAACSRGLTIHDYFSREELTVANAVPTAEGALQLAMEHLPVTVHGTRALILGFGRVGRITAQRFAALGAKVTVSARSCEQLAWAQAMGLSSQHLTTGLANELNQYDLVINTIPTRILSHRELGELRKNCLIIDLASNPGGVDRSAAEELGINVIHALALPGKVAPVTAAAAIKQTIYNMLRELGPQRPGKEGIP